MKKSNIVVIGSINMDLVCRVRAVPAPGETLAGQNIQYVPGGKGANQAVAAARLGGRVHMVGRVGDDMFGQHLRGALASAGVNVDHVRVSRCSTGLAMILLQPGGENSIVLSAGANHTLTAADIDAALPILKDADVVLVQLEIPTQVVVYTATVCRRLGVPVVLDPAPVSARLPKALLAVDVISPNQAEAALLAGQLGIMDEEIAHQLFEKGARQVVLKLGNAGAKYFHADGSKARHKGYRVKVVDTTAAGDSMTAGLAVAMAEGLAWPNVLQFANAAGALAVTKFGAQPSIPTRRQVLQLISKTKQMDRDRGRNRHTNG